MVQIYSDLRFGLIDHFEIALNQASLSIFLGKEIVKDSDLCCLIKIFGYTSFQNEANSGSACSFFFLQMAKMIVNF